MTEQSEADLWNDLDLPTLPGLENLFGPDHLKGSLRDMPDMPVNATKAPEPSMVALNKAISDHLEASEMSASDELGLPGEIHGNGDSKLLAQRPQAVQGLDNEYDGTSTRSNPETPLNADFVFDEGSPALKRVHSEQGTAVSSSRLYNATVGRSNRIHDLNSSLLNTPFNPMLHSRPGSRLREEAMQQHRGTQDSIDDIVAVSAYNRNLGNTRYDHNQEFGVGQHMSRSQYPDPSVSSTQDSIGVMPYSNLPNYGNKSLPSNYTVRSQRNLIPNPRSQSLAHQEFDMLKQESPDFMSNDLVYASFDDANRDRATNTLALNDRTVPRDELDKQNYVNKLKDAMMDMRFAEDNDGMISTWNKMRQDANKVEQACWALVEVVMRAYNPNHIGPLVAGTKPNNKYESFHKRIDALVDGLRTQKTMCKHIMAPPYVDQLVDDPLNAITRIKNNRKVNLGKKVAIQKGRSALGEKGAGKGRRNIKIAPEEFEYEDEDSLGVEHDNADGEYDLDEEEPTVQQPTAPRRHSSKRKQPDSEDDQTYGAGRPQSKKAKRPSRSMYQVNEHGQMVDTSQEMFSRPQLLAPQYNMANRVDPSYGQRRPIHTPNLRQQAHQQSRRHAVDPEFGNPYGPTDPAAQVTESQTVLPDYDNELYNTSTSYTSGNEIDNDYHHYDVYGSDIQPGGASGQSRRL